MLTFWIGCQILAAGTTLPLAEEMAFRGFLMRRAESPFFLSVDPRSVRTAGVFLSAFAFSMLYADHWLASAAAGAIYAVAYRRRGEIGDAVAAHATHNALLAASGLLAGYWALR